MPSIDDLKNNKKQPFIPSIVQGGANDTTDSPQKLAPHMAAGIKQGASTVTNGIKSGMTFNKKPSRADREAADFSSLPKTDAKKDNLGVEMKTSIEDEIFKPGGDFDKYVEAKKEAYYADMDKLDNAMATANPSGEIATSENVAEEKPISEDAETTIIQPKQYRAVNLKRKEENEEMAEDIVKKIEDNDTEPIEEVDAEEQVAEEEINEEDVADSEVTSEEEVVEDTTEEVSDFANATEKIDEEVEKVPAKVVNKPKEAKSDIASKVNKIARTYMALDEEEEEKEDDVKVETEDEQINLLKDLISQKIKPVSKKLNLDSFTIAKKGNKSNTILQTSSAAVAKWVLPTTGVTIQMREISGANMELIRSHIENRTPNIRAALKIIYDHIVSPKPIGENGYDLWLKSVAFADFDHLFMAAYIASFTEANYLPIDCVNPACKKAYLTDNIDIMSMIDFADKESENKFWELYNSDVVQTKEGLYVTKIVPISDRFAIAFTEPSLYSTLIESNYFTDQFAESYGQTIAYNAYIDNIYYINTEEEQLERIDYEEYANNISRTVRSKIVRYDKILNTLTPDQHAMIAAHVNAINNRDKDLFTYQIPETTCPNCGHVTPASKGQTAQNLLFLRNRLAVLATI